MGETPCSEFQMYGAAVNTTDCGKKNPFVCAKSNIITETIVHIEHIEPLEVEKTEHIEPEVENRFEPEVEETLIEAVQLELPSPKKIPFGLFVGIILGIIFIALLACLLRFVCCLKREQKKKKSSKLVVPKSNFTDISENNFTELDIQLAKDNLT